MFELCGDEKGSFRGVGRRSLPIDGRALSFQIRGKGSFDQQQDWIFRRSFWGGACLALGRAPQAAGEGRAGGGGRSSSSSRWRHPPTAAVAAVCIPLFIVAAGGGDRASAVLLLCFLISCVLLQPFIFSRVDGGGRGRWWCWGGTRICLVIESAVCFVLCMLQSISASVCWCGGAPLRPVVAACGGRVSPAGTGPNLLS